MRNSILSTWIWLLIAIAASQLSCSSSSSYAKKAAQLEQAGLYEEAANFHYIALLRNPNNVEAKIGLKQNGQKVIDELYAKFYQAHGAENFKEAVARYEEADAYRLKMAPYVKLDYAPFYEQYYQESKEGYLSDLYEQSAKLMEESKFEQAQVLLKEIGRLDPNYADVQTLKKVSQAEPLYQEGVDAMQIGEYVKAYQKFDEVITIKGRDYKDAAKLRNEALDKATIRVAILPFEDETNKAGAHKEEFYSKIVQELVAGNNQFIRLIDRKNLEKVIAEQKLGLSGLIDEKTAARAGKLLGAEVVMIGKITAYAFNQQLPQSTEQKGYVKTIQRQLNRQTGLYYNTTVWEKTTYQETKGEISASATFSFQLVSSESGEILTGGVVQSAKEDRVLFASFEGQHQFLFPGTWQSRNTNSDKDQVFTNATDKQQLDRALGSRKRTLKSAEQIRWDLTEDVGKQTATRVLDFVNNRP